MVGLDASVVAIANPRIAAALNARCRICNGSPTLPAGPGVAADLRRQTRRHVRPAPDVPDRRGRLRGHLGGHRADRERQWRHRPARPAGVFGALLLPSTLAIVREAFPTAQTQHRDRHLGRGLWRSVAAGPILGGLLIERFSWESVFYINVPIAIVAVLLGSAAIVESLGEQSPAPRHRRHPVAAGGLSMLVFRTDQGAVGLVRFGDPGVPARRRSGADRLRDHRTHHRRTCCRCGCSPTCRCRSAPRWSM